MTCWGEGVQATTLTDAGLANTEAATAFQLADSKLNLDQTLFVEWALSVNAGEDEVSDFLNTNLFSFELGTALDAWVESGSEAPTPFGTDDSLLEELAQGEAFEAESAALSRKGAEANQTGDEYVLVTVILTSALFFAGISTVLKSVRVRYAILSVGGAFFLGVAIAMATFPVT